MITLYEGRFCINLLTLEILTEWHCIQCKERQLDRRMVAKMPDQSSDYQGTYHYEAKKCEKCKALEVVSIVA